MSTASATRTVLVPLGDRIVVRPSEPEQVTASVAAPVLTTDALVADKPEPKGAGPAMPPTDF